MSTATIPAQTSGPGRNHSNRPGRNGIDAILSRCVADLVTDCVLFTNIPNGHGYCNVRAAGWIQRAHRYVYEQLVGPIPEGMTLDHTCEVKVCVNPDHLEIVTNQENTRRYHARGDRRVYGRG